MAGDPQTPKRPGPVKARAAMLSVLLERGNDVGEMTDYIRRLIELGHFNQVCSTEVDIEMAERALALAIKSDNDPG